MRRLPRDLIAFALLISQDWTALMSGLFSIILAALGAGCPGLPGWSFWIAAMIALFVAMFRAWQREHREKEQIAGRLAGDELAAHRMAKVAQLIEGLSTSEKAALRYILRIGAVSDLGIQSELHRQGLPDADLNRLASIGVIWREVSGGGWSAVPEYAETLRTRLGKE